MRVIRLTRFIHVPRRFRRQVTNTFLFARDRYRCQYCGRMQLELKPRESLTRDHLVPLSRGGTNEWTNVQIRLTTFDVGNRITSLDVDTAAKIDVACAEFRARPRA